MAEIDYLEVTDESIRKIKLDKSVLEHILISSERGLDLDLTEWKEGGIRITFSIPGLGIGFYNEKPYKNDEEAIKEYEKVLNAVQNHNYILKHSKEGLH